MNHTANTPELRLFDPGEGLDKRPPYPGWDCLRLRRRHRRDRRVLLATNEIWHHAVGHEDAHALLCIACLEARLGRSLTSADFPDVPVNRWFFEARGHPFRRLRECAEFAERVAYSDSPTASRAWARSR